MWESDIVFIVSLHTWQWERDDRGMSRMLLIQSISIGKLNWSTCKIVSYNSENSRIFIHFCVYLLCVYHIFGYVNNLINKLYVFSTAAAAATAVPVLRHWGNVKENKWMFWVSEWREKQVYGALVYCIECTVCTLAKYVRRSYVKWYDYGFSLAAYPAVAERKEAIERGRKFTKMLVVTAVIVVLAWCDGGGAAAVFVSLSSSSKNHNRIKVWIFLLNWTD